MGVDDDDYTTRSLPLSLSLSLPLSLPLTSGRSKAAGAVILWVALGVPLTKNRDPAVSHRSGGYKHANENTQALRTS